MSEHINTTAIIGMGKTGQAAARFLLHQAEACEAFDESAISLPDDLDMVMHTGPLDADVLKGFARLIVSPGVNWHHPALVAVREAGIPVFGDLELFSQAYHGDLIAITGTNGKTTTVSLISTMLDTLSGGIEAGGNIGVPMLALLAARDAQRPDSQHSNPQRSNPQRIILELSSFQLERANPIHPNWAALLNVQPDHADMHADMQTYEDAKLRLFARQDDGDKAMLPADERWNGLADTLRARGVFVRRFGIGDAAMLDTGVQKQDDGSWQVFWHHYDEPHSVTADELPTQGMHQHLNLAVAAQAAADFGISASVIRQSLTSFRGLPHRLQSLGIIAGREWYNDSKATNPDAASAALESFHQVIWICGGLRKGLDVSVLREAVAEHVEQMFVIGTEAKPFTDLAGAAGVPFSFAKTIEQAVKLANHVMSGVPVLLSPAAASQDQFTDYIERGNRFAAAVSALESGR